jgi:hypothetical protein
MLELKRFPKHPNTISGWKTEITDQEADILNYCADQTITQITKKLILCDFYHAIMQIFR